MKKSLFLWTDNEVNVCYLCGNWSARLVRFALWIGYGIQTAMSDTVAIHSSCIVYRQKGCTVFRGKAVQGKEHSYSFVAGVSGRSRIVE